MELTQEPTQSNSVESLGSSGSNWSMEAQANMALKSSSSPRSRKNSTAKELSLHPIRRHRRQFSEDKKKVTHLTRLSGASVCWRNRKRTPLNDTKVWRSPQRRILATQGMELFIVMQYEPLLQDKKMYTWLDHRKGMPGSLTTSRHTIAVIGGVQGTLNRYVEDHMLVYVSKKIRREELIPWNTFQMAVKLSQTEGVNNPGASGASEEGGHFANGASMRPQHNDQARNDGDHGKSAPPGQVVLANGTPGDVSMTRVAPTITSATAAEPLERNENGKRQRSEGPDVSKAPGDWRSRMERTVRQQAQELAQLHRTARQLTNLLEAHAAREEVQWAGVKAWMEEREEKWEFRHEESVLLAAGISNMVAEITNEKRREVQREIQEAKGITDMDL
ncbi:hypothetical protein BDD12DRAFT_885699 [Trichophaea hybrida]|nr:hypothetical protein BDD12DRAFT_885699 [Trichophaea hybrida]